MGDPSSLLTIAGIIIALGIAVLLFRIQRELKVAESGERTWIAFSDWLALIAMSASLLFVVLPLSVDDPAARGRLPAAASAFSVVLALGYVPGILAHYRLIFPGQRTGPRENPEPAEFWIVVLTFLLALLVSVIIILR
jgi:hypothetical protein